MSVAERSDTTLVRSDVAVSMAALQFSHTDVLRVALEQAVGNVLQQIALSGQTPIGLGRLRLSYEVEAK